MENDRVEIEEKEIEIKEIKYPDNTILIVNIHREIVYSLFHEAGDYIGGKQFDAIKKKYISAKEMNNHTIILTNDVEQCMNRLKMSDDESFYFLDGKQLFFNTTQ
jgi:hypothetical protein